MYGVETIIGTLIVMVLETIWCWWFYWPKSVGRKGKNFLKGRKNYKNYKRLATGIVKVFVKGNKRRVWVQDQTRKLKKS